VNFISSIETAELSEADLDGISGGNGAESQPPLSVERPDPDPQLAENPMP
jgi:hypothetical protein